MSKNRLPKGRAKAQFLAGPALTPENTRAYMKNPVVLLNGDPNRVVAMTTDIDYAEQVITMDVDPAYRGPLTWLMEQGLVTVGVAYKPIKMTSKPIPGGVVIEHDKVEILSFSLTVAEPKPVGVVVITQKEKG
jgi:hypothetical protein